LSVTLNLRKS